MSGISTAIGSERRSRLAAYKISRLFRNSDLPNLPQQVVILAEANTANQSSITTAKQEITTADQAGKLYGYGSPIHQIMRILRPVSGDGIGGIPTVVMPQLEAEGATASVKEWTVTGTATGNATHTLIINGRTNLDGKTFSFAVATGDTPTVIAGRIKDLINSITGLPVSAANTEGVLSATTKWKGASSDQFLKYAIERVTARGGRVANLEVTLICERPKIGPLRDQMRARIAEISGVDVSRIAVKATTSERLGFTGREEGIAATASATIRLPWANQGWSA